LPRVEGPNITFVNCAYFDTGYFRHVNAKRRAVGAPPLVAISISFSTASSALEQVFPKEEEKTDPAPLPAQAKGATPPPIKTRSEKALTPRRPPFGNPQHTPQKKNAKNKTQTLKDHFCASFVYATPTF
jgi:hypothetical protein